MPDPSKPFLGAIDTVGDFVQAITERAFPTTPSMGGARQLPSWLNPTNEPRYIDPVGAIGAVTDLVDLPKGAAAAALPGLFKLGKKAVGGAAEGAEEAAKQAIRVYHGSRARPFRSFSDEKLGTGQGAHTFGYGHYTAEGEPTAKSYLRRTEDPIESFEIDVPNLGTRRLPAGESAYTNLGKEREIPFELVHAIGAVETASRFEPSASGIRSNIENSAGFWSNRASNLKHELASPAFKRLADTDVYVKPDPVPGSKKASDFYQSELDEVVKRLGRQGETPTAGNIRAYAKTLTEDFQKTSKKYREALRMLDTGQIRVIAGPPRGGFYEIDMMANPQQMLDLDALVKQQPELVLDAIRSLPDGPKILRSLEAGNLSGLFEGKKLPPTGTGIHQALVAKLAGGNRDKRFDAARDLAHQLSDRGVVGYRYLDQGSRGWTNADVMVGPHPFRDDMWAILDRSRPNSVKYLAEGKPSAFATRQEAEAALAGQQAAVTRNYVTHPGQSERLQVRTIDGIPVDEWKATKGYPLLALLLAAGAASQAPTQGQPSEPTQ